MAEKTPAKAKRGPGRPIQPGQVLNPKGRPPKGYSLAEFMRAKLEDDGGARLEAVFDALYNKATLEGNTQAAQELLTRAYGKPADTVKIEDLTRQPPTATLEAMRRLGFTDTGSTLDIAANWQDN